MNLFKLQEEKEDIESNISYYKRERERLKPKFSTKATSLITEKVDGRSSLNSTQQALDEYVQLGMYLDEAIEKLDNVTSLVNDKYKVYSKYNDYDKQIYIEKKLYKWNNAKISLKHNGISKRSINRIIKKMENDKVKIIK